MGIYTVALRVDQEITIKITAQDSEEASYYAADFFKKMLKDMDEIPIEVLKVSEE